MPGPWLPASSKGGGMALGVPDVCIVPGAPPIPTPFPNMGQMAQADGTVDKVLVLNKEIVVMTSKIPQSSGDEAGTNGGVVSGTTRDQVAFRSGSSKVMAKGKKVVTVTTPTAHNGANANMPAGLVVQPSQSKVLVAL